MRVTRIQAEENRSKVIEVASRLFRQRGFDGIGLKDLMAGAGLTQGGFYKQFESKEDLAAQACQRAMGLAAEQWSRIASAKPDDPFAALVDFYLGTEHRDEVGDGCPLVALGSDAGRQGPEIRASFEAGINAHLDVLDSYMPPMSDAEARQESMVVLSTMVGALLLSRATDSRGLSSEFLAAAKKELRQRSQQRGTEAALRSKGSDGLTGHSNSTPKDGRRKAKLPRQKKVSPKERPLR